MSNVIFSDMPCEFRGHAIFLAGPTPRSDSVQSWRPEAIRLLETLGYTGTVLVPERRDWKTLAAYEDQVEWEEKGLTSATKLLFWVPRALPDMMALTTNVEFGRWIVKKPWAFTYGRPDNAVNCRYLDWLYATELEKAPNKTLESTLKEAVR